ncbi:Rhodanese-like domain-containing protein [Protomyces lactucae-debilis]|uniref:Rhodanese-like domain-containing protein n=1 Tax=Protomyces lactucae-debilis TaxID=2754530 RepID=A0A1Y2FLI3_PROLT|nr:Rhodanese-like domain-containing protein [Protomyces lactucae-debilis]ORY83635.1 Rhodanese-like domain-containing protein [Protomyces lactucae-debilis]
MSAVPQFVKPKELAQWLKAKEQVAIIDVRDDDYAGGAIKGHTHVPSAKFPDTVASVISDNQNKDKIIFHCSLSQQRGPKGRPSQMNGMQAHPPAARMYQEAQNLTGQYGKGPQIYILEGGFVQWQREFGKDAEVTAQYDEAYWQEDHF